MNFIRPLLSGSMRTCAVIPARQGSSLVHKNIRQFADSNLLEIAVRVALSVEKIDRVMVSSDSEEYLEIARRAGAETEMRPPSAATSISTAQDVVDSIDSLLQYERLVYLQPTSPLRTATHISEALDLSDRNPEKAIVSVTRLKQYPEKILSLDEDGFLREASSVSGGSNLNRPKGEKSLYPNGAIYILTQPGSRGFSFLQSRRLPYYMDSIESVDIDSDEDFELAKVLFEHGTQN